MDKWFRAAKYLSAGQLYLLETLLRKPLPWIWLRKRT